MPEPIYLYNTLNRSKEIFTPHDAPVVRVYSCGPTVYSRQHIGNLRAAVFVDTLKRMLRYNGLTVEDVVNITDVGHLVSDEDAGADKLDAAAKKEGRDPFEIARQYEHVYLDDLKKLAVVSPKHVPRATEHIEEQIRMIQAMEANGFTYTTDDGVYFDTGKLKDYGKLSGQRLDEKEAGARVAPRTDKRHHADFALWKFIVGEHASHIMQWPSPWGTGFPGWHIECSAMGEKYLGPVIDIHTGGIEHIPVHHENEIAQNQGSGALTVRFWVHNEHLLAGGTKMAKSLGNVFSLDDLNAHGIDPLSFRYWLLTAHFQSSINFSTDTVLGAQHALERLTRAYIKYAKNREAPQTPNTSKYGLPASEYREQFHRYINDNLDTPKALALAWDLVRNDTIPEGEKATLLENFDRVLGIGLNETEANARMIGTEFQTFEELPGEIQDLLRDRERARTAKDWHSADSLRQKIEDAGYHINDTDTGTEIHRT